MLLESIRVCSHGRSRFTFKIKRYTFYFILILRFVRKFRIFVNRDMSLEWVEAVLLDRSRLVFLDRSGLVDGPLFYSVLSRSTPNPLDLSFEDGRVQFPSSCWLQNFSDCIAIFLNPGNVPYQQEERA
jgi:hypothetical protein